MSSHVDRIQDDFQQIGAEHTTLLEILQGLDATPGPEKELALVTTLRGLLDEDFREEERPGGFFARVVADAPRARSVVDRLTLEHATLRNEVADAMSELRATLDGPLARARARVHALSTALREHEAREAELLAGAFYDDVGVGD